MRVPLVNMPQEIGKLVLIHRILDWRKVAQVFEGLDIPVPYLQAILTASACARQPKQWGSIQFITPRVEKYTHGFQRLRMSHFVRAVEHCGIRYAMSDSRTFSMGRMLERPNGRFSSSATL